MSLDSIENWDVEGTNIYDALLSADKILDISADGKKRAVILISDGQLNVGDAPLLIDYAQRNNLVLYTIGVGTESGGESVFNMISKADINFLKSLAFGTNGKFFRIDDNDFSEILSEFDSNGIYNVTVDLSMYLIIMAIFLFFINWILYNFRFRIFP